MIIFCRFIVAVVEKKPLAALCSAGISPDTHRNNVSFNAMLTLDLTLIVALNLTFGRQQATSGTTRLKISLCIKTYFEFLQNDSKVNKTSILFPNCFYFHDLSVLTRLYKNYIKPPSEATFDARSEYRYYAEFRQQNIVRNQA